MLNLALTTDKLQLVTSSAADISVHASFIDYVQSPESATPGKQNTAIASATTTDIVASPAASTFRNVKFLSFRNKHASTSNDVTVLFDANGTDFEILKCILLPGESLVCREGVWFHFDANAGVYGGVVDPNPVSWIRQAASRTLTSTTAEQKLFDSVTNGALTLPTGVFFFEGMVYITGLSATSGNMAFDILGAGTAVLSDVLYQAVGIDGAAAAAATQTGSTMIQGQSPASIVTAGTATACAFSLEGTFEVTTAGTIIPSVSLVTAAAGTVAAGTYFKATYRGVLNAVSQGQWS